MRLLDLFCGAGGAATGYHRAGFDDIVGIDIVPQPNYPFRFIQADALTPPVDLDAFDLIHASPPCQAYSTQGRWSRWGTPPSSPPLIGATQTMLDEATVPFVIENVPGARGALREPMLALRGDQFGLKVRRLRYFELGHWYILSEPLPPSRPSRLVLGVYGRAPDGRALSASRTREQLRAPHSVAEAQTAMGINWVDDWRGIAEAVPPAYTEYIGRAFLDQLARVS